jgi:hypothetical protein
MKEVNKMKKLIIVLTIAIVGIAAFSFVGSASAQAAVPEILGNGGPQGPRGGHGDGTGVPMERNINLDGMLDDMMASYIADELGITVEKLKSREAAGESLVEIGLSLGFDQETIFDLHTEARLAALTQAVEDGLITQTEADWLISRLDFGQYQYGANAGTCTGDCTPQAQKRLRNGNRGNRPVTP